MKKLIVTTSLAMLLSACAQTDTPSQGNMMRGNMMKNCPMMAGDTKMHSSQKMMKNCQDMMAKDHRLPMRKREDKNVRI